MTKDQAIEAATETARKHRITVAVYLDPEDYQDESDGWQYAAALASKPLMSHIKLEQVWGCVTPEGKQEKGYLAFETH